MEIFRSENKFKRVKEHYTKETNKCNRRKTRYHLK